MKELLKSQSKPLLILLLATYLLNIFDLWFTLYALDNVPGAFEMNPFFQLMLRFPVFLCIYKYAVLPFALYIMYRFRALRLARFGQYLCFAVFLVNTVYQIWSISLW